MPVCFLAEVVALAPTVVRLVGKETMTISSTSILSTWKVPSQTDIILIGYSN
jgi:hypothetical protein